MKSYKLCTCICILFFALSLILHAQANADEKTAPGQFNELDQAVEFLKKNVIGKTMVAPKESYIIDDGKLEAVFGGDWTFSNLQMTETGSGKNVKRGFSFDVKSTVSMTKYNLDAKGKRVEPAIDSFEREDWKRYFVTERKSTGELFGLQLTLDEKGAVQNDSYTRMFQLKPADGKIVEKAEQVFYDDISSADSPTGFEPGAYESVTEYYLNPQGKLESKTTFTIYSVDPSTMKRLPWKNQPGKTMVRTEK